MSKLAVRALVVYLVLVALGGVYSEWRVLQSFVGDSDFPGYYTAALLVRRGHSAQIYAGQQNVDPTAQGSDPHSVFARAAAARGIRNVPLYDYPPTLADLLVPFTFLPPVPALLAWEVVTALAMLGSGILLAGLLGLRGAGSIALVTALLLFFRPTVATFVYGQVPVLLLLLIVAGLHCHARGRTTWAGLFFALPIAIKLTPLILIVPLLAWRDWKTLRAIALWGLAIVAALWAVNGTNALNLYVLHRVPSMSHGFIDLTNMNLRTAAQVFWYGTDQVAAPMASVWAGRLLSLLVIAFGAWLCRAHNPRQWTPPEQLVILSAFLMFSACMSPIAWRHGYVLAAPALLFLGQRIRRGRAHLAETALVLWFILALSTDKFAKWAWTLHHRALYDLAMMPPVLGVILGLIELDRIRRERQSPATIGAEAAP